MLSDTRNRHSTPDFGQVTPATPVGARRAYAILRTLKGLIKVKEGGRSHKISAQAGMLLVLREKALKGDARALDRLLNLGIKFNNEPSSEVAPSLSADDQAILAAYEEEIRGSSASIEPLRPAGLIRRPLTRKE
jgi:hypothetical protein